MDAPSSAHPSDQTLSSFGLGKLDDASAGAVQEHLMECQECRQRVAQISADSFLGRVREAQKAPDRPPSEHAAQGATESYKSSNASPPPAPGTLPPGLADHPDYEIKKELGRGGMGVVYLAHNKLMGRDEVLKVMDRKIMERPGVLDRFLREIRAVARLKHPNIVTAYSAFRLGDHLVFAMEYVEGLDLARMVKAKGPLPVAHACNFIHQAALGLQHAHEEGLVHRDIKPGNLMLSRKGAKPVVKVLDFGLAKVTREQKVEGGLTHEGQALGTPEYMAPEQILDAPSADVRADIYSLGGALYYLLTGSPPFRANSLYDLFQAHISREAEPLNLVRPEVPTELAAVVSKMMAKEPAKRFQTPGEVAKALEPFFKKGGMAYREPRPEVSGVGEPNGPPAAPSPTGVQAPASVDAGVASDPPLGESRWESLLDTGATAPPGEVQPAADAGGKPPRRRLAIALSGGGLSVLFGAIVLIWNCDGKKPAVDTPTASKSIVNSIGMKLVLIPAGEFEMGMTDEQIKLISNWHHGLPRDNFASYQPRHHVRMTRNFYMGATEVTRGQYRRFVEATGHKTEMEKFPGTSWAWKEEEEVQGLRPGSSWLDPGYPQTDEHPVVCVNWEDAQQFCQWLGQREGFIYRLPTEAEWEYCCRAGSTSIYHWGDDPEAVASFDNTSDRSFGDRYPHFVVRNPRPWKMIVNVQDGYVHTAPVAKFRPNAFGLFDMHGNVEEWCSDWYDADYYKYSPVNDPCGPPKTTARVLRGGYWAAPSLGSAFRHRWPVEWSQGGDCGFRVVRDIPSAQSPPATEGGSRALSSAASGSPAAPRVTTRIPADGPARRARWVGGSWRVEGDELVKDDDGVGGVAFGDLSWTDYDLTFEARKSAGPDGLGAQFRESHDQLYWFMIGSVYGNHYLDRWSREGSVTTEIAASPGKIRPGEWYKVEISLRGSSIRVKLDNHMLFDCTDDSIREGGVELKCWGCDGRFRNIKVTAPDGSVLWEGPPDVS